MDSLSHTDPPHRCFLVSLVQYKSAGESTLESSTGTSSLSNLKRKVGALFLSMTAPALTSLYVSTFRRRPFQCRHLPATERKAHQATPAIPCYSLLYTCSDNNCNIHAIHQDRRTSSDDDMRLLCQLPVRLPRTWLTANTRPIPNPGREGRHVAHDDNPRVDEAGDG